MPLSRHHDRSDTHDLPSPGEPLVDPRVTATLRSHQLAGIAAVDKWHQAYMARNPGDMRMTPGNFSVATAAEAQRLRDGRPKVMRSAPEIELAAMETEKIRSSLVKFLQDWGIVARPGSTQTPRPSQEVPAASIPTRAASAARSVDRAKTGVPDSPWPAANNRTDAMVLPDAPWPIAAQPAAAVGTPPSGTPTTLYELLHATLHGAVLKSALDRLWDRVRDPAIPLPSRQDVEAAWQRYLRRVSPARDRELKAFFKHWGLLALEQIGERQRVPRI